MTTGCYLTFCVDNNTTHLSGSSSSNVCSRCLNIFFPLLQTITSRTSLTDFIPQSQCSPWVEIWLRLVSIPVVTCCYVFRNLSRTLATATWLWAASSPRTCMHSWRRPWRKLMASMASTVLVRFFTKITGTARYVWCNKHRHARNRTAIDHWHGPVCHFIYLFLCIYINIILLLYCGIIHLLFINWYVYVFAGTYMYSLQSSGGCCHVCRSWVDSWRMRSSDSSA